MALIEMLVALAVLGICGVAFLSGMYTTTRAAMVNDEQATAESLARSQMEYLKKAPYDAAGAYTPLPLPADPDFSGYAVSFSVQTLEAGMQAINVTVTRSGSQIFVLEGYKVNRCKEEKRVIPLSRS